MEGWKGEEQGPSLNFVRHIPKSFFLFIFYIEVFEEQNASSDHILLAPPPPHGFSGFATDRLYKQANYHY